METIGLISDTHGLWRPSVASVFDGVDLIVHAGDVGRMAVLDELERLAPVVAVWGNADDGHNPRLAAVRTLPVGGLVLRVSHGHELGGPTPSRVADAYGTDGAADVLVFGHTHKSVIARERRAERDILVVNPGAAGPRRFHLPSSVALLTIDGTRAEARIIDLD